MTLDSVYFFESPSRISGFFDDFMGGLFLVKGLPLIGQLGLLTLVALGAWSATVHHFAPDRRFSRLSNATAWTVFLVSWFFLLQPWDEVFINLRHSFQLAHSGRFSFNANQWLEGTVDFLPYFLLGCLGKLGLPLVELAFFQGLVGAALCLFLGLLLVQAWTGKVPSPFLFLALVLYPPLAFNSAHGFATTLFMASILAAVYFLFFSATRWGFFWVALLPLVRVEAALLSALLLGLWVYEKKPRLAHACLAALGVGAPFAIHTGIRLKIYQEAIPLPVLYKSSLGSPFFFAVGMRNLAADAIATHLVTVLLFLGALKILCGKSETTYPPSDPSYRPLRLARRVLGVLAAFTVPYYLSGGDWFPSYWGRYLFPLGFFAWLYCLATASVVAAQVGVRPRYSILALPIFFFLLSSLWPISSTWKGIETLFAHRRTLARIHEPTIARGHYRIQHLSQLGRHLKNTTVPTDRIGTSELATIPYFAERNAIDFLGLVNPIIARSPLRAAPDLLRQFPMISELPYLIFRRLRPDLLEQTKPEILYTFDFLVRDQIREVKPYELTHEALFTALNRWEHLLGGLIDTLYGGLEHILTLDYKPVIVKYADGFVALYFVHQSILARHLDTLRGHGFTGGYIRSSKIP